MIAQFVDVAALGQQCGEKNDNPSIFILRSIRCRAPHPVQCGAEQQSRQVAVRQ